MPRHNQISLGDEKNWSFSKPMTGQNERCASCGKHTTTGKFITSQEGRVLFLGPDCSQAYESGEKVDKPDKAPPSAHKIKSSAGRKSAKQQRKMTEKVFDPEAIFSTYAPIGAYNPPDDVQKELNTINLYATLTGFGFVALGAYSLGYVGITDPLTPMQSLGVAACSLHAIAPAYQPPKFAGGLVF